MTRCEPASRGVTRKRGPLSSRDSTPAPKSTKHTHKTKKKNSNEKLKRKRNTKTKKTEKMCQLPFWTSLNKAKRNTHTKKGENVPPAFSTSLIKAAPVRMVGVETAPVRVTQLLRFAQSSFLVLLLLYCAISTPRLRLVPTPPTGQSSANQQQEGARHTRFLRTRVILGTLQCAPIKRLVEVVNTCLSADFSSRTQVQLNVRPAMSYTRARGAKMSVTRRTSRPRLNTHAHLTKSSKRTLQQQPAVTTVSWVVRGILGRTTRTVG